MVFSFCRAHCVSMLFLVFWTEQRGTTAGTPQQWEECRYEKINRFFLQSRQCARLQKVGRCFSYLSSPPNSGFFRRMSTAWTKTNNIRAHGGRNFWGKGPCQSHSSYPVRSKVFDSPYPHSSFLWLSWPLSRGFLFLSARRHYTLRGLPA